MTSIQRTGGRHGGRRRTGLAAVGLLASLSLVAGACTRSDDAVETGSPTTEASGGGSTTTPEGGSGAGDFGDLKAVCGPGDASGATAQGVTDDAIQVGTISDPGFVGRAGLNQELFDAAEVFAAWCNDAGGINGRTLEVVERDAKLTEYKQRITEACQEDFMLVGGGGVFDDTGQEERLSCMLPDVPGYQVSAKSRGSDLSVAPLPSALDETPIALFQYLDEKYPGSGDDVGFVTGNVASTILIDKQNQEAARSLGWKIGYRSQYNSVGEASWTPFAEALKNKGARGLVYTGEPENAAKLLQAIDDIGHQLDWVVVGGNHLDAKFIELGADAVHDVYLYSFIVPFFLADENPATKQYQDLFDEYLPDGKKDALLGVNAFSAFLLFATAAKACGSEVTRRCVYEEAAGTSAWSGGGLHSESDPSSGKASRCGTVVVANPDGFSVPDDFELTDGLFRCADDSMLKLEGDYGEGATLESVGKSMDDLE